MREVYSKAGAGVSKSFWVKIGGGYSTGLSEGVNPTVTDINILIGGFHRKLLEPLQFYFLLI